MKPSLSTTDCIPLDPADDVCARNAAPSLERAAADPRDVQFRSIGIRAAAGGIVIQPENGKLILNDGDDAANDVWQRLSLDTCKPVRSLDVEPVVSSLHRQ